MERAHQLLNVLDIHHDLKDSKPRVEKVSAKNYMELAFKALGFQIKSKAGAKKELNAMVDDLSGKKELAMKVCNLKYLADKDGKRSTKTETPFQTNFLTLVPNTGTIYAFQDSGKSPNYFYKDIQFVYTPGSLLDSGSGRRNFKESQVKFVPGDEFSSEIVSLNSNDFKNVALEKVFSKMTVTYDGISKSLLDNKSMLPHFKFILYKSPQSVLTDNIKFIIDSSPYSDQDFLSGNPVLHKWLNKNLNKTLQRVDSTKKQETYEWMFTKLLGDCSQAQYLRKFCNATRTSIANTCLFTLDTWFALRARLLGVPVMLSTKKELKEKGRLTKYYHFFSAAKSVNPYYSFENANQFKWRSKKAMVEQHAAEVKEASAVYASRLPMTALSNEQLSNFDIQSAVSQGAYWLCNWAFRRGAEIIPSRVKQLFGDIDIYNNVVPESVKNPYYNRRMTRTQQEQYLVDIGQLPMPTTIPTTVGLKRGRPINTNNGKNKNTKRRPRGGFNFDDTALIAYTSATKHTGPSEDIDFEELGFDILLDDLTEREAILNAISESLIYNGFPDGSACVIYESYPELCDAVREKARAFYASNTKFRYLVASKYEFRERVGKPLVYAEDVFTLLFSYFQALGEISVNPVFYDTVLARIVVDGLGFVSLPVLEFSVFEQFYNNIHNEDIFVSEYESDEDDMLLSEIENINLNDQVSIPSTKRMKFDYTSLVPQPESIIQTGLEPKTVSAAVGGKRYTRKLRNKLRK